jgi:small subunit ribosomal protein S16
MKMMGRAHRPFFRVCVMDKRTPRDGRVIEELGYYDPMVPETDARAVLKADRIDYWLSVGAKPSDRVATLIKKYGTSGTHLEAQKAAVERLNNSRRQPPANPRSPKSRKPAVPAKEATAAE